MLVAEIKGQETDKDRTKLHYLDEWVKAVNAHGGFGEWKSGVCLNPADLPILIQEAART
jgi:type III restriction enzyme